MLPLDRTAAFRLLIAEFPDAVDALRSGIPLVPPGFLSSACTIIQEQAQHDWEMREVEMDGFAMDAAQYQFRASPTSLGRVVADAINRLEGLPDAAVRAALAELGTVVDARQFLAGLFLQLFIAHELLHIVQRLGSSQYQDSDGYSRAVNNVDYQADVASAFYVSELHRAGESKLSSRNHLLLTLCIHICVMHAFSTMDGPGLARAAFERLLIWNWQAARVAAALDEPHAAHPSIAQMPTLEIAELPDLGAPITMDAMNTRNQPPESRQDIVISCAGDDGIYRVVRLRSTSDGRARAIVAAVLNGDFHAFRTEMDELFRNDPSLVRFSTWMHPRQMRAVVEKILGILEPLAETASESGLEPTDPRLLAAFSRSYSPGGIGRGARGLI